MSVARHFTATGFVVHDDHVALHWHPKVEAWLPPGGHINENEDPVQAVLREIEEEAGLEAEVVSAGPSLELEYPSQVPPPFTIMVEDIHDPVEGYHQHIDMIYFCRLTGPADIRDGWRGPTEHDSAHNPRGDGRGHQEDRELPPAGTVAAGPRVGAVRGASERV